jgi:uncharacterized protein (DUF779 family)
MFNYKEVLQDMNIEEYIQNPLTCDCSHSPFQCHPSGHVITGDLNIIQHESLRKVISHGPKFREPQHINWKHNLKIIMDVVEDYAERWIKREVDQDPELESLSDLGRTIRSLVQCRIHKLKNCVNSRPKSIFKDQDFFNQRAIVKSMFDKNDHSGIHIGPDGSKKIPEKIREFLKAPNDVFDLTNTDRKRNLSDITTIPSSVDRKTKHSKLGFATEY